jgi:hypothetical protein
MIVDHKAIVDDLVQFLYTERDDLNAGKVRTVAEMVYRQRQTSTVIAELRRLIEAHTKP